MVALQYAKQPMQRSQTTAVLCAAIVCLAFIVETRGQVTASAIVNTAGSINTRGWEDSPFLSAVGKHLYFLYTPWQTWPVFFGRSPYVAGPERTGHHVNPDRNPWEDSDIYVSDRSGDGRFSTPVNIGFNDAQADCCVMTWANDRFVYQRTQWPNSGLTDIYFVDRAGGKWVRRSAGAAVNGAKSSESNPHVTADGQYLFFTSDRAGGFGKNDLYVSARNADGSWGEPQNLGPSINTADNEDQAWVSRDQQTLYFNREPGPRVLTSVRLDSGWAMPSMVRFGSQLIDGAEVSITDDGSTIVLASVRWDLEDIVLVQAKRLADQTWGALSILDMR
jgi:hypothetical protein